MNHAFEVELKGAAAASLPSGTKSFPPHASAADDQKGRSVRALATGGLPARWCFSLRLHMWLRMPVVD